VATKYDAQNQIRSGVLVRCITVPAVTDVSRRVSETMTQVKDLLHYRG
jgi:hypothetical protein